MAKHPNHIPIGLVSDAVVVRLVDQEQQLSFDDVEIPETSALRAWKEIATRLNPGQQEVSAR
jgi:predicted homoserine dehydrogenase-like protein